MIEADNVRTITARRLTRRAVLRGSGVLLAGSAIAGLLQACASNAPTGAAPPAATAAPAVSGLATSPPAASAPAAQAATAPTITTNRAVWGYPANIEGLDNRTINPLTESVVSCGLEGLIRIDANGQAVPSLAESWTQKDSLTYVYQLRQGAKFWDGSPVTVEDVVYSLLIHKDTQWRSNQARRWVNVESVTGTGPSEVTIKLKTQDPTFKYVPYAGRISPKKFLEQHVNDLGTPAVLNIGSGPYQFVEFVPDDHVTLKRFDGWWGPRPSLEEIVIKIIPDETTRFLAIRSNQIDGANDVSFSQVLQWKELPGLKLYTKPGARWAYFTFNVTKEPWSDIHVRRAFAHSVDKKGLVEGVLHGYGSVSTAISSRGTWSALIPQAQVDEIFDRFGKDQDLDPEKAKAELKQSAYPDGFTANMLFNTSRPVLGKAALNLAENLKKIGITLNVSEATPAQFSAAVSNFERSQLDVNVMRISDDWPDPATYMFNQMHSSAAVVGNLNYANYKNPEVDALFAQAASTSDAQKRAEALAKVLEFQDRDLPYLPFWEQQVVSASNDRFAWDEFNTWFNQTAWATGVRAVK